MFKRKSKFKELIVSKLANKIKIQNIALRESINIIKNYGNLNKRKKQKISQGVYQKVSESIYSLPVQMEVMREIILNNKRLNKKYLSLLQDVSIEIARQVQEQIESRPEQNVQNKLTGLEK